jgi:excisionase family DNA binding protein
MDINVKLRQKRLLGGKHSLYLDFYPPILHPQTGELTRREFLGFYILDKPKTLFDHEHNNETLQLAEEIRKKRDHQLNHPESMSGSERNKTTYSENSPANYVERALKLRLPDSARLHRKKISKTDKTNLDLREKPFLSVMEVCILLGISRRTVSRLLDRGELAATKFGRRLLFKRSELDELFDSRKINKP